MKKLELDKQTETYLDFINENGDAVTHLRNNWWKVVWDLFGDKESYKVKIKVGKNKVIIEKAGDVGRTNKCKYCKTEIPKGITRCKICDYIWTEGVRFEREWEAQSKNSIRPSERIKDNGFDKNIADIRIGPEKMAHIEKGANYGSSLLFFVVVLWITLILILGLVFG